MTQRREGGDGGHQHPQSKQTDGHPRPELGPAPPLAKGPVPRTRRRTPGTARKVRRIAQGIGDAQHRRTMSGCEHLRPAVAHNDQICAHPDSL